MALPPAVGGEMTDIVERLKSETLTVVSEDAENIKELLALHKEAADVIGRLRSEKASARAATVKERNRVNILWTMMEGVYRTIAEHPGTGDEIQRFAKRLANSAIGERDIELVRRMSGPSKDINATGYCTWCNINLYADCKPDPVAMPCGIGGCPFEHQSPRVKVVE